MAAQSIGFGSAKYGPGLIGRAPSSGATSETNTMPTMGPDDHDGILTHPHNPLAAFGVIAAVVFGLMAFSTSVRVGKTSASLSIGDTK